MKKNLIKTLKITYCYLRNFLCYNKTSHSFVYLAKTNKLTPAWTFTEFFPPKLTSGPLLARTSMFDPVLPASPPTTNNTSYDAPALQVVDINYKSNANGENDYLLLYFIVKKIKLKNSA